MTKFTWTEISSTPASAGVYAWYYTPEITEFDLEVTIKSIKKCCEENNEIDAKNVVIKFLKDFLFNYFTEDPYEIILRGPLKPKYKGEVEHIPSLSDSLVERIVENPSKLNTIKEVLETSSPNFASPIYIGMSDNLFVRLNKHKRLIEKYNQEKTNWINFHRNQSGIDSEQRDQSFAWQVCKRKIVPTQLFVITRELDKNENSYVDIENILNRIHYPLFGRN